MARKRKTPDAWTIRINAIVLKDSRQEDHVEISYNKIGSVYSNIKAGGRRAQNSKTTLITRETQEDRLSILEPQRLWRRSSKQKAMLETKETRQDELSVLEHQHWWDRSSKRKRNTRYKTNKTRRAQCTRTSMLVWEELKIKRNT